MHFSILHSVQLSDCCLDSIEKFTPNMYADDTSSTLGGEDAHQLLEDFRNELQDVKIG